jgi:hypothetical protein
MNDFFKNIIEERFKSKKQQKYFYAKANDKSLPKKERKKWANWADEFSNKTDFDEIPDEVKEKEQDMDEIVDASGNIKRGAKPGNFSSKYISPKKTSDTERSMAKGSMGMYGVTGTVQAPQRYWGESDMSKALGYEKTLGQDADLEDAEEYFEKELGMDGSEAEDRLSAIGYDPKLPEDKVRLVENPKKFIEEYIESLMSKKSNENDIVTNDVKEISPIVKKQIKSLKNTMDSHNLSIEDLIKHLKDNE